MSFGLTVETPDFTKPLWEQYRNQFPVTQQLVYLNHAAVAPLCKPAADAMIGLAEDVLRFGALHYDEWSDAYEGVRVAAAHMIGAHRDEIALVKNTSEGISTVALGLNWRPGDRMVAFEEEFPANIFPWKRLEQRGVKVQWLSIGDSLETVDRACTGARLLSVSFIQYLSGFRANLQAIGEICQRRNCLFLVDAIQGLGAFPVDVSACHIDALAADGHKWLLGPEGCGILYVRRERQEMIVPVELGWSNMANYADYGSRDMALRPDAGRYECGSLNTIGCFGLRAALQFLLEVKIERISAAVQALGDRIVAGAANKGYEALGNRTLQNGAGIVSIRKPGIESRLIVRQLKDRGIQAAPRLGWVRMSPHFYISPQEIDSVIDALP